MYNKARTSFTMSCFRNLCRSFRLSLIKPTFTQNILEAKKISSNILRFGRKYWKFFTHLLWLNISSLFVSRFWSDSPRHNSRGVLGSRYGSGRSHGWVDGSFDWCTLDISPWSGFLFCNPCSVLRGQQRPWKKLSIFSNSVGACSGDRGWPWGNRRSRQYKGY